MTAPPPSTPTSSGNATSRVHVVTARSPLTSDDTFADLEEALDNLSTPKQQQQQAVTGGDENLSVQEENEALRLQVEELRQQMEYWKTKAEELEQPDVKMVTSPSQTGFFEGLRHISFSTTPTVATTSEVDHHDATLGLHQRRSGNASNNNNNTASEGYFDNWNSLSPFRFGSASASAVTPTFPSTKHHHHDDEEGVSLVTAAKSHASDRDEDELNDDDDDDDDVALNVNAGGQVRVTTTTTSSSRNHQDDDNDGEPNSLVDRGAWLVGLLVLQSFSSFIIKNNEAMLQRHAVIVRFLTMLVGAGGNAGNQASVRVIRGLAIGKVDSSNVRGYLFQELRAGFFLSVVLGIAGAIRAAVFFTPLAETLAITASLVMIVGISIFLGTILPLLMKMVHIDPAHSSTTIQVLMDILGVAITVYVSSIILDSKLFSWLPRND